MARPANVAYISAVREYARKRPLYRDFERRLRVLLINLLDNGKVDYSAVQSRTKGISSFALKIQRKNYANPLKDTVDLCGLRVIVYYLSELGRVTDIIENEFVV